MYYGKFWVRDLAGLTGGPRTGGGGLSPFDFGRFDQPLASLRPAAGPGAAVSNRDRIVIMKAADLFWGSRNVPAESSHASLAALPAEPGTWFLPGLAELVNLDLT